MQVACERSNTGNDVRCDVCGQGFVVHWMRLVPALRTETRLRIIHALRRQHREQGSSSHHAHAEARFTVTAVSPEARFAGSPERRAVAAA